MNMYMKMPILISDAAKFFKRVGNNVLKDYYDMLTISKRTGFAKHTMRSFNEQAESFELENNVFIDGMENFKLGMTMFCLTCVDNENILIYDVLTSNFFWGNSDNFFINDNKCASNFVTDPSRIMPENSLIPESMLISWFLTGMIHGFYAKDIRFEAVLAGIKNSDNFYFR